ncbi:MAG: amidohydrolase family protein [Pseudomonadales bacterium]|nr:amidohydrolase family protein [Pseudomonadales bacterium]
MKNILSAILLLACVQSQVFAEVTLISNVQIFDGVTDKLSTGHVLVEAGMIKTISATPLVVPDGAVVIDGTGRTLMPGLIDSHVHLTMTFAEGGIKAQEAMTWEEIGAIAAASAQEHLMNGFTTVRDMGGLGTGLKRAIDKGLLVGPRIYSAGAYISQTSGHGDMRLRSQPNKEYTGGFPVNNLERLGIARIADGIPAVLTAVRENFAEGAAYIKIHAGGGVSTERDPLHVTQYTKAELAAANESIRHWDTYWTVHAYNDASVNHAIDAGAECVDHAQLITEPTMRRIVKEKIFLSPNLTGMSDDLLQHPVYGDPNTPVGKKVREFMAGSKDFPELVRKHRPKWVFNSDIVFSPRSYFRQHMDFEKHIAASWFGNFEALKALTSRGGELAQLTGRHNPYPAKLGVIEEGAYADLLIVDGNPLEDMGAIGADSRWFSAPSREGIENIRVIMKGGEICKNTL